MNQLSYPKHKHPSPPFYAAEQATLAHSNGDQVYSPTTLKLHPNNANTTPPAPSFINICET